MAKPRPSIRPEPDRTIAQLVSQATPTLALLALLATCIGFLWLARYCDANGVPLPLSASDLPIAVLAVGAVGVVTVFVYAAFALMPLFCRADVFAPYLRLLFEPREYSIRNIRVVDFRSRHNVGVLCWLWVPTLIIHAYVLSKLDLPWLRYLIPILALAYLIATIRLAWAGPETAKRLSTFVLASFAGLFWCVIIANVIVRHPAIHLETQPGWAQVTILALSMIGPIIMFSVATLMPIGDIQGLWRRVGTISLAIAIVYPLAQPISLSNTMSWLSLGGYRASIVLGPETPASVTKGLGTEPGRPQTVSVILRVGDYAWVRTDDHVSAFWLLRQQDLVGWTRM